MIILLTKLLFIFTLFKGNKASNPSNCAQTDSQGQCTQCVLNYVLDISGQCICSVQKCTQCLQNDGGQCTICQNGYYLTSNFQCCSVKNCDVCSSQDINQCQLCSQNFQLDDNFQCIYNPCSVQNCSQCVLGQSSQCQICKQFHNLDQNQQCVQMCNVPNCLACIENNPYQCETCIQNYVPQGNFCVVNCLVQNCSQCVFGQSNQCQVCNQYYQLDLNSQCTQICNIKNCLQCVQDNPYQCETCIDNYIPLNQSCVTNCLVENCFQCIDGQSSQCMVCNNYYQLDQKNVCVQMCSVQNCLKCIQNTPYQCDTCAQGYIPSSYFCVMNCLVENCSGCEIGQTNRCQFCNQYYQLDENKQCVQMCSVPNCQKCIENNPFKCQTCIQNYTIKNELCEISCQVQNCLECLNNDSNQCQTCINNYTLDKNNQCIQSCQIFSCISCVSNNKCQQCSPNYYLDANGLCQFDCKVANCQVCMENNQFQCSVCNNNYILDSNQQCFNKCLATNCEQCIENNQFQCAQCSSNYILDKNSQCIFNCQVSNCQKCNQNNPFQCIQCKDSFLLNVNDECVSQASKTDFTLSIKLIDGKYILQLNFTHPLVINNYQTTYLNSIFKVQISNTYDQKFNFTTQFVNRYQLQITITPQSDIQSSSIILTIQNQQFLEDNTLIKQQTTQQLPPYIHLSEYDKSMSDKVSDAGNKASQKFIFLVIPTILMGNAYLICNTLDITGYLYYYLYLDVNLPYNVQSFYGIFKNFNFPFIPNMFEIIISGNYQQPSPSKFMLNGTDNYFISGTGQSFTIIIMVLSLYFLAKIFCFIKIPYLTNYCKRAVTETWEYGGLLDLLWSYYIYVVVGLFMQFNTFEFGDESSAFINYALHIFIFLIYLGVPILLLILIFKNKNLKENKKLQSQIPSILSGLNLYDENDANLKNIKNIFQEVILIIIQVCCLLLSQSKSPYQNDSNKITYYAFKELIIGIFTLVKRFTLALFSSVKSFIFYLKSRTSSKSKSKNQTFLELQQKYITKMDIQNHQDFFINSRRQSLSLSNIFSQSRRTSTKFTKDEEKGFKCIRSIDQKLNLEENKINNLQKAQLPAY
ncbi:hypothetical protein ABPG74_022932 [Tetrahymena malaccensis]